MRQGIACMHQPCFALQVEAFEEVERAFVHVDYQARNEPEHKVMAPLFLRCHNDVMVKMVIVLTVCHICQPGHTVSLESMDHEKHDLHANNVSPCCVSFDAFQCTKVVFDFRLNKTSCARLDRHLQVDYNLRHKRDVLDPHDSLSQHGSSTAGDVLDMRVSS